MNITLASLPTGHWRELTKPELDTLLSSIKDSDGTEQASKGAGAGKQPTKNAAPKKPVKPTKAGGKGGYEGRSGSRNSASGKGSSTRQSNNKSHKGSHSGRGAHKSSNRRG